MPSRPPAAAAEQRPPRAWTRSGPCGRVRKRIRDSLAGHARAPGSAQPGTHAQWAKRPGRAPARTDACTHNARAGPEPRPPVRAPVPPGGCWEAPVRPPARPARSFTYSKRHPCGRPTALTFGHFFLSALRAPPGTPTSSAPSRPRPRPAAAAARDPACRRRRLSRLRRCRHLPRLFRPAGPHLLRPQPGVRRLAALSALPASPAPAGGPLRPPARARGPVLRRCRAGPARTTASGRALNGGANQRASWRRGLRRRAACLLCACALGGPRVPLSAQSKLPPFEWSFSRTSSAVPLVFRDASPVPDCYPAAPPPGSHGLASTSRRIVGDHPPPHPAAHPTLCRHLRTQAPAPSSASSLVHRILASVGSRTFRKSPSLLCLPHSPPGAPLVPLLPQG